MAITISNDVTRIFPKYEAISVGSSLTGADSGKVFKVSGSGGTVTLNDAQAFGPTNTEHTAKDFTITAGGTINLKPAEADTGIIFKRTDIKNNNEIKGIVFNNLIFTLLLYLIFKIHN